MSFRNLEILSCYESGINDIVNDFYAPVLSEAVSYDRIAGFFSSSSLAIAARGMSGFIANGGKMRLICSPILNPTDYDIIQKIVNNGDLTIEDLGVNYTDIESEFEANHVKALGWMLSNGLLEIKLALIVGDDGYLMSKDEVLSIGLFHQKVGILQDKEGNKLSFSGSINETASAWLNNDEEFKVFKQWEQSSEYFEKDFERFDNLWKGNKKFVHVYDLPSAIRNELIRYCKDFELDSISVKNYLSYKKEISKFENGGIALFYYQKLALQKWEKCGFRMLFEMATGTGKTRTAVCAMQYLMSQNKKLIAIVTCPQNTLARQWKENEVEKLGIKANIVRIVDGTNKNWANDLKNLLLQNGIGFANHCIVYTTHDTASSDRFIDIVNGNLHKSSKVLFIGDEVHWLGAKKMRKALLDRYDYRIGLSATPSRWFDDNGTKFLEEYFGNNHFEFTIKDALNEVNPLTGKHFLVNYYYNLFSVSLNDVEADDYYRLTERIIKLYRLKEHDSEAEENYNRLLERRADIIKNAENKYQVLKNVLENLRIKSELENLIIFVSPQQKESVKNMLFEMNIPFHQLTQAEGTKEEERFGGISERQHIINCFKQKIYKVLVAIKCLDEGIDIPTATRGILMASSTNPREYIQRIGRIIRQSSEKEFAFLYDIYVNSIENFDGEMADIERKIRMNEKKRLMEISDNALNSAEVMKTMFELI